MDTNEREEKEVKNYPEKQEEKSNILEEPAFANDVKRYSYADYLTWLDDKRAARVGFGCRGVV
jgi:hypothetical protein